MRALGADIADAVKSDPLSALVLLIVGLLTLSSAALGGLVLYRVWKGYALR